jgi:hypothetical protein
MKACSGAEPVPIMQGRGLHSLVKCLLSLHPRRSSLPQALTLANYVLEVLGLDINYLE